MNMVRRISLVVVVALLANLGSPAAVQAGGCQGDRCDFGHPALVPEGGIAWDRDDFGRWLQSSHVSGPTRDALRFANESQEVIPMVVIESAYTEWLSSCEPLLAEKVERSVVRVRGSDLSVEIIVHDTEGTTAQIDLQSDYIIMSTVWCDYCRTFVAIVIAWALMRWVSDPLGDIIDCCGQSSLTGSAGTTARPPTHTIQQCVPIGRGVRARGRPCSRTTEQVLSYCVNAEQYGTTTTLSTKQLQVTND